MALRQHKGVVPPSTLLGSPTKMLAFANSFGNAKAFLVVTLALGSRPKQGVTRLWAKKEARESCHMLLGVQKSVRE
jgi:hypothetical protein